MDAPRKRRLMSEINVVPLIDVMLVLLIIFMATAPMLTQGVKVDLPQAGAEPLPMRSQKAQPPVILSIDSTGQKFLNTGGRTDNALSDDELLEAMRVALVADPDRDVLVRADTQVAYGRVINAMVVLQTAGASKIGFLTDPLPQRNDPAP